MAFYIYIRHANREPGRWGGENIGHFRWSVVSDVSAQKKTARLEELIRRVDTDPWRAALRDEVERKDTTALIERARNHAEILEQPIVSQFQLMDALLKSRSTSGLLSLANRNSTWQTPTATRTIASSKNGSTERFRVDDTISVRRLEDGSYSVDGNYPLHEQISLVYDWSDGIPTAVKLEVIPETRNGTRAFGRSEAGWVDLVDFSLGWRQRQSESDHPPISGIPIDQVLSDLPTHRPLRLAATVDGDYRTFSPLFDSGNPHQIIFLIDDTLETHVAQRQGKFELQINIETWRHLARFRLSFSNSEFDLPDPKREALELARFVCAQQSNEYWAQVKLATTCLAQSPPGYDEALSHAIAANALEPQSPSSAALVLETVSIDRMAENEYLQRTAVSAFRRLESLSPNNGLLGERLREVYAVANKYLNDDPKKAATYYKFLIGAATDDAQSLSFVAATLTYHLIEAGEQSQLPLAVQTFQRALDLNPEVGGLFNNLGVAYRALGQRKKAIECFRKEIELFPDSAAIAHSNLASCLAQDGELQKAIEICRQGAVLAPNDSQVRSKLGNLLLQNNQLDQAQVAFQSAVDLEPKNSMYWLGLSKVLAKLDRPTEAKQMRTQAILLGPPHNLPPERINEQIWEMLTAEDERLRDYEVGLVAASWLSNTSPNTNGIARSLGVAHYRNGNWREAIDFLTDSVESSSQPSIDAFFLAMSNCQLGQLDLAHEWFARATEWMDASDRQNPELIRIRNEAEDLLNVERPPRPT